MRAQRLAALVSLALLATMVAPVAARQQPGGAAADRYIVVFHDSVANPVAAAEDLGRRHAFGLSYVYQHALKGFAASIPSGAVDALARDPRVAWIEPDQAVHAYDLPTGVERIFADDNPEITIDGTDDFRVDVDVAIIDTGIDLDHPDLNVNVADSVNCLNSSGGPPFSRTYSCEPGGDDDNEHGTHVAGTVGALDNGVNVNGVDVVGVAPGARLWAVKVLDANGSGSLGAVTAGIDYVTGHAGEIEVANMSLGCECTSAAMNTAIAKSVAAGVTYAVAAGNSNADAATHSPANHPDVITVSALADFDGEPGGVASLDGRCRSDGDDTLADFSNWGSDIEIAAPGVCILSTVPGGGYDTFSGTSMASPHVAGAAALLASNGGTPSTIEAALLAEGNLNWTDDSGDDTQEPLLDVSDAAVFTPATVAGEAPPPDDDNTAPLASNVSDATSEDMAVSIDLSGSDMETCELTFSIIDPPAHGDLSSVENAPCTLGTPNVDTGTVTYTPDPNYNGTDSFTYRVSDGSATDDGTVSVTTSAVNDAPVAVDDAYSTPTDTTLGVTAPGVLANDSDVDGDPLTAVAASGLTSQLGSYSLNTDGSFSYTPPSGFTGTDSFSYTVISDGNLTDTGTVTISVGSVMTISSLTGSSTSQGKTWSAFVTITIADGDGLGVAGASVSGTWTYNGTSAPDTCTTGPSGQCTVDLTGIAKRVGSVTFTVSNVEDGGAHDWDDINQSEIVSKP